MTVPRLAVRALTASIALVIAPLVVVQPAQADTPGCVSRQEYRKARNGTTRGKVHRIFDISGMSLFENTGRQHNSAREYRMCAPWRAATGDSKVQVQYNNYAANGGPQRVAFKQHY